MAILGNQIKSTPYTVDVFSGDGSDPSFELTRAPASTSSIAVLLMESIKVQQPIIHLVE